MNKDKLVLNGVEIQDFDDVEQVILSEFSKNPSSKLEYIKKIEAEPHAIDILFNQKGEEQ